MNQPSQQNSEPPSTTDDAPEEANLVAFGKSAYDPYVLRVLKALRRIIRSVDIHSRHLAQEHGVTVPQLLCLMKIDELGSLTLKDLAAEVHLNPSTIVGIVDRLESAGLFERERSERDRRRVRISLTEKGRRIVSQSPSPLQDTFSNAFRTLPELEKATIALSLERIIPLIESRPGNGKLPEVEDAPVLETASDLEGIASASTKPKSD